MTHEVETHQLSPDLAVWHRYDAIIKADLFSAGLRTDSGFYLVDAISIEQNVLGTLLGSNTVAGLIVTNANHRRVTPEFSQRFAAPVFAHPDAKDDLDQCEKMIELSNGSTIAPGLTALTIDGAAPGEIALHWAPEGGTLIFGDALINMGSGGFSFLPDKYCLNPKLMRRSLERVLDYPCERILFAHGTPIVSKAQQRLTELLRACS